jgi:hypothetical protein
MITQNLLMLKNKREIGKSIAKMIYHLDISMSFFSYHLKISKLFVDKHVTKMCNTIQGII